MKREIKFRAWDKPTKKMLYPQEVIIKKTGYDCVDRIEGMGFSISDNLNGELMQFTGLYDKNGKEIYEGDIMDYPIFYEGDNCERAGRGFVQWDEEQHYIAKIYRNGEEGYLCSTWDMAKNYGGEVIGNIFENPELLNK